MDDSDCTYEAHTSARGDQAVVIRSERRRRWSDEAKLRIVQETLVPGTITSLVARRHGIGTGQLYTWRKQMLAGAMAGFMPVELCASPVLEPEERPPVPRTGLVEIVMPSGTRVMIAPEIERAALKKVLGVISELGR
ncbi:MAG: transposase [Novosphingobium sp.]|nr:transposase [Novosphingobium sp.]